MGTSIAASRGALRTQSQCDPPTSAGASEGRGSAVCVPAVEVELRPASSAQLQEAERRGGANAIRATDTAD